MCKIKQLRPIREIQGEKKKKRTEKNKNINKTNKNQFEKKMRK